MRHLGSAEGGKNADTKQENPERVSLLREGMQRVLLESILEKRVGRGHVVDVGAVLGAECIPGINGDQP